MSKIDELEQRLKELAKETKKRVSTLEGRHRPKFERQARYVGNGIYSIAGLHSTDTRELMLMFTLQCEGVKVKDTNDPVEGDEQ